MPCPSQLFSQIRARKARPTPFTRNAAPPRPAPAPAVSPAPPLPTAVTPPDDKRDGSLFHLDPPSSANAPAPRRPAGHALYSQVMRRHDRAGKR